MKGTTAMPSYKKSGRDVNFKAWPANDKLAAVDNSHGHDSELGGMQEERRLSVQFFSRKRSLSIFQTEVLAMAPSSMGFTLSLTVK
jgi:hypothetical protein